MDVGAPTPGTGYDQIRVTGEVRFDNVTFGLETISGYAYAQGQVYTLIDNDGTDPVVGHFSGLPEGATINAPGGQLRISYFGGDGNDVTLTALSNTPRLSNLSTRMQVLTGNDVLIGGFVIGGSAPKRVVIRARGPSLASVGTPGPLLANPQLQLFSGQTQIAFNDNWQEAANAAELQGIDLAPADPWESAVLATLAPGGYTAIVTGVGGTTGTAIVEIFDADQSDVPLINIATRGKVLTGNDVMIAGFVIAGTSAQSVVVRVRGPSLTPTGVPGVLANPQLQLFSGQNQFAFNDNWQQASNAAQLQASGFAPSDPAESAILITLNPGAYTAIASGVGQTTGVAIIEVFKN